MNIDAQKLLDDTAARVADVLVNGTPAPAKKIPLQVAVVAYLETYQRSRALGGGWKWNFREQLKREGIDPDTIEGLDLNGPTLGDLRKKRETRAQALGSLGIHRQKDGSYE